MKKIGTAVLCAAVLLLMSGNAFGQGQGKGKPASTGVQHAESTANAQGVSHGIDNAETKQATHKHAKQGKHSGKHKGKHKGKRHTTTAQ